MTHIMKIWSTIVEGLAAPLEKVDSVTVQAIELRCPRYSTDDSEFIVSRLSRGEIFSEFGREERMTIWERLRKVPCVIPSLFTFLRDVLFFQAWTESIRHIIPLGQETTHVALQISKGAEAHPDAPVDAAARKLWIFAIQNCRRLSQQPRRRKERLLAKIPPEAADDAVLARFAALADHLGFQSAKIDDLKPLARGGEAGVSWLADPEPPLEKLAVAVSANVVSRCGYPTESTFENDRQLLSMHNLHVAYEDISAKGGQITSFFVIRSQYLAFFGNEERKGSVSTPSRAHQLSDEQSPARGEESEGEGPEEERNEEEQEEEAQQEHEKHEEQEESEEQENIEAQKGPAVLQQIMSLRQDNSLRDEESEVHTVSWSSEVESATDEAAIAPPSIIFLQPQKEHEQIIWKQHHREPKKMGDSSDLERMTKQFLDECKLKSWTIDLDAIPLDRCLQAVTDSGVDIIILLPTKDFEISSQLVRVIGDLRRGINNTSSHSLLHESR